MWPAKFTSCDQPSLQAVTSQVYNLWPAKFITCDQVSLILPVCDLWSNKWYVTSNAINVLSMTKSTMSSYSIKFVTCDQRSWPRGQDHPGEPTGRCRGILDAHAIPNPNQHGRIFYEKIRTGANNGASIKCRTEDRQRFLQYMRVYIDQPLIRVYFLWTIFLQRGIK